MEDIAPLSSTTSPSTDDDTMPTGGNPASTAPAPEPASRPKKRKLAHAELVARHEKANTTHMIDDYPRCRPPEKWDLVRPYGLVHVEGLLTPAETQAVREFIPQFQDECVPRFGIQYPNSANRNFLPYKRRDGPGMNRVTLHETAADATEILGAGFRKLKRGVIAIPDCIRDAIECALAKLLAIPPDSEQAKAAGLTPQLWQRIAEFEWDTAAVHLHHPGAGLEQHFDNAADEGDGFVFMLSFAVPRTTYIKDTYHDGKTRKVTTEVAYKPHTTEVHREFLFDCPMEGWRWPVRTPDGTVTVFTLDGYDKYRHGSVKNHKQTEKVLSVTVRAHHPYVGYTSDNDPDNDPDPDAPTPDPYRAAPKYKKGARNSNVVARERWRAKAAGSK